MKEKLLYGGWIGMYALCVGLGTIQARNTAVHIAMMVLALLFYVPGILLVFDAVKADNKKQLLRLRLVCSSSLVLTAVFLVGNIAAVGASETAGRVLNDLLMLVSAPMFCCYWRFLSLLLWGCLLFASFPRLYKK